MACAAQPEKYRADRAARRRDLRQYGEPIGTSAGPCRRQKLGRGRRYPPRVVGRLRPTASSRSTASVTSACRLTVNGSWPVCRPTHWPPTAAASMRWPSNGIAKAFPIATKPRWAALWTNCFAVPGATMRCLALGELALERGDYAAARRYWEQISPLTRDPNGKPLWLSLRDVDLDKHWPEIEQPLAASPTAADLARLPDTDIDLPDLRARLVLVSIRSGEFDRAALELDAFRRWHPEADGPPGWTGRSIRRTRLKVCSPPPRNGRATAPIRNWPTFAGAQFALAERRAARSTWAYRLGEPITLSATKRRARALRISTFGVTRIQPTHRFANPTSRSAVSRWWSTDCCYADAMTVSAPAWQPANRRLLPTATLFRVEATGRATRMRPS